MRAFRFRLERLKKVRTTQERVARNSFAAALTNLNHTEASLGNATARRVSAREELRPILGSRRSASSILTAQRVTDRFDDLVAGAHLAHTQAATAADGARATWAALRAKSEGLTRLRTARESEHRREYERFLARELDEIAMTRAAGSGNYAGNSPTQIRSSS